MMSSEIGMGISVNEEEINETDLIKQEIEKKLFVTDREKNAKNRLFKGTFGIGKDNPISLKTDNENAYRVTGERQIQDIMESGYVRPPLGKLKGGHVGEVHWAEGNDRSFYCDRRPVLEIEKHKVLDGTIGAVNITDLKALWVFNNEKNEYEDRLLQFKKDFLIKKDSRYF